MENIVKTQKMEKDLRNADGKSDLFPCFRAPETRNSVSQVLLQDLKVWFVLGEREKERERGSE